MCRTQSDYVDFGKIKHSEHMSYYDYSYEKAMHNIVKVSKTMTDASYELFRAEHEDGDFASVYEKLSESIEAMADVMSILGVEDVQGMLRSFSKKPSTDIANA